MELDEALKNVSVLGAAGKMGSGISLLLLQAMVVRTAQEHARVIPGKFQLNLIDMDEEKLSSLRSYLRKQLTKYSEKNIVQLRKYYASNPHLVSNEEIIDDFIQGAFDNINFGCSSEDAKDSCLIFEAVVEDVDVKINTFAAIAKDSSKQPYFLTNTSSIPIHILNEKANLNHRILGFHFYNPPAVQKLIEIIVPNQCDTGLKILAEELGKRLHKVMVYSNDIAGFIGNGYFARELLFACKKAHELSQNRPLADAIVTINQVTQDFLLRPMGIFQLMDYVGIDICQKICKIMGQYLPADSFNDEIIDQMLEHGFKGGQNPDGTQKVGFFRYEGHVPKAVYSFKNQTFEDISKQAQDLGSLPIVGLSWKFLQHDSQREEKLKNYLQLLSSSKTFGAELAQSFLKNLKEIADTLVRDGVAHSLQDVNTILKDGFYHLYGVGNENV